VIAKAHDVKHVATALTAQVFESSLREFCALRVGVALGKVVIFVLIFHKQVVQTKLSRPNIGSTATAPTGHSTSRPASRNTCPPANGHRDLTCTCTVEEEANAADE